MRVGAQHPSMSRVWFQTERPQIGSGIRVWLRLGVLRQQWECEFVSWNEWDVTYSLQWRWRDVVRVYVGPGVIPF